MKTKILFPLMLALTAIVLLGCTTPVSPPTPAPNIVTEAAPVASIPLVADLLGTWKFSYGSTSTTDDTWIFNSDNSFYYTKYTHSDSLYAYQKGTWSLDINGVFIANRTHVSETTTNISDVTTLADWVASTNTFSASTLIYDKKLYMGTYFSNALGIMTRDGVGSGIIGTWSYISVDGLTKMEDMFDANNFTVTRYTRTATTGAGSTWLMDGTGPISGGTYTLSNTTITCIVPSGYAGPAGTYQQFMVVSEPYLISTSPLSGGMIKN